MKPRSLSFPVESRKIEARVRVNGRAVIMWLCTAGREQGAESPGGPCRRAASHGCADTARCARGYLLRLRVSFQRLVERQEGVSRRCVAELAVLSRSPLTGLAGRGSGLRAQPSLASSSGRLAKMNEKPGTPSTHLFAGRDEEINCPRRRKSIGMPAKLLIASTTKHLPVTLGPHARWPRLDSECRSVVFAMHHRPRG